MAEIKIVITIPESEYEEWSEYQEERTVAQGIEAVKTSVKADIRAMFRRDWVKRFEIEVTHNP